ncbi:MAG: haloacid dehalogenase type II [Acidobacteria bacterium]|nr:haloacid dehalogenase type II [Acidobacteriota bacterium]
MPARPLRLEDVEAITFDCYGTLIDWEGGTRHTLQAMLARWDQYADEDAFFQAWERAQWVRIQQSYARYRTIAADAFLEVARAQQLPLGAEDAQAFADAIATWKPFPDTSAALAALKRRFRLGIISNMDDDILSATVKLLGVEFDLIQTAEQARAYKPSPVPFARALERLRVAPERVAHAAFGFEYDIGPASQLGFRTILVRRSRTAFPATPVPDLIVADLADLAAQFG